MDAVIGSHRKGQEWQGLSRSASGRFPEFGLITIWLDLARIMHYAALFCMSGARTRADVPSGENGGKQLVMQRVRGCLPCWRLVGAHRPAAHGPEGMRPSATHRNSA